MNERTVQVQASGTSPFDRAKLMQMLGVFQHAVIDISAAITQAGSSMPAAELEDGRYVAGVATICAANCEAFLGMSPEEAQANGDLYCKFLGDAAEFAAVMEQNGYGKEPVDVDL